jgi:hypothetical protein
MVGRQMEKTHMYLFNRSLKFGPGNTLDSMAWAMKMTEKVNTVGGVPVNLWTRVLGPEIGTVTWSAIVTDIAELTSLEEKLMADSGYIDLVEEGSRFGDGNGANDTLGRLVHADAGGEDAQYVNVTIGQLVPGMTATGMALGVEMAQRMKSITGRPTSFGTSLTGPMGQVAFFQLADTIEQLQAGSEALAADADWIALVDSKASKVFSSAERLISRKLA